MGSQPGYSLVTLCLIVEPLFNRLDFVCQLIVQIKQMLALVS
jgi:hypothetical protein